MSHKELAIKFANKQFRNRYGNYYSGNSMFINGETIYSYGYHFPIAMFTGLTYQGREIVMFNSRGYSNSTAKHKYHVWSALHDHDYIIIDSPGATMRKDEVINYYQEEINEYHRKEARARKENTRQHYYFMSEYYNEKLVLAEQAL